MDHKGLVHYNPCSLFARKLTLSRMGPNLVSYRYKIIPVVRLSSQKIDYNGTILCFTTKKWTDSKFLQKILNHGNL